MVFALGMRDTQQRKVLGHADHEEALFSVVLATVEPLNGERVLEDGRRQVEATPWTRRLTKAFALSHLNFNMVIVRETRIRSRDAEDVGGREGGVGGFDAAGESARGWQVDGAGGVFHDESFKA